MKKLPVFLFWVFTITCSSLYSQFHLKKDSTVTSLLGFSKQNLLILPLNDSIQMPSIAYENLADSNDTKTNMPIIRPTGDYPMPIHKPDLTVNYKMKIFVPETTSEQD